MPLTRAVDPHPFIPDDNKVLRARCRRMLQIQAEGLARRVERAHADGMVLGISGGLDSCLALLVAVRAAERLGISRATLYRRMKKYGIIPRLIKQKP